jgi:ABC-2 type transport system ATP-binding protein
VSAVSGEGLAKSFGSIRAVDGVDVRVEPGEVRGLLGPNGAGKTTLLRMLFGLVRPDAGSVRLLGSELDAADPRLPDAVGGFVEEPRFYPYLSARRNLELLSRLDAPGATSRVDEALDRAGLQGAAQRRVGGFSSGMRQRLGLAAALVRAPALVMLDEPTAGLDPGGVRDARALVRSLARDGAAVLLSTHVMAEVDDVCDAVTIMSAGRVVWEGDVERLRREAPAPARRLSTSDDPRALALARSQPGLSAEEGEGGLLVSADDAALDAFVLDLGRAGVAVRRLELVADPLEAMFFSLTGAG